MTVEEKEDFYKATNGQLLLETMDPVHPRYRQQ